MQKMQLRFQELSKLTRGVYENFVAGILSERQYRTLSQQYDAEQTQLEERMVGLEQQLAQERQKPLRVERFIQLIRLYKSHSHLTDVMLRELIDKVEVHQAEGGNIGPNKSISTFTTSDGLIWPFLKRKSRQKRSGPGRKSN